jgi:hypothetical protein
MPRAKVEKILPAVQTMATPINPALLDRPNR